MLVIAFSTIDCLGQGNQLCDNKIVTNTRRSQQVSGDTVFPGNSPADDNPFPESEFKFELDDDQEDLQTIFSIDSIYTGEVFNNARGGISTNGATQYQGLLDLVLSVDLGQSRIPLPGKFAMLVQNTQGRGLTSDFIGDTQVISNIDTGDNIMQVSEYWWEFGLLAENITVRLGKQDLNSEFLLMDLAAEFIQSSFGLSPSEGFPSYPDPSMAAVLLAQLRPSLQMKIGVWDGFANGGSWGFSDNDLVYFFTEIESKYAVKREMLKGAWSIGFGFSTEGELNGIYRPFGYGFYFQLEQLVYRENPFDDEDDQGLGFFVSYFPKYSSGAIALSAIEESFVGGIVYRGLIPGRDADVIGGGVAWAELNQGGTNQETVAEAFYKLQVSPSFSVKPDIQYIASPSGVHPDALAVGFRFQWTPNIAK